MFCWNCGKQNPDKAQYCSYCGSELINLKADSIDDNADHLVSNDLQQNNLREGQNDSRLSKGLATERHGSSSDVVREELDARNKRTDLVSYVADLQKQFAPMRKNYECIRKTPTEQTTNYRYASIWPIFGIAVILLWISIFVFDGPELIVACIAIACGFVGSWIALRVSENKSNGVRQEKIHSERNHAREAIIEFYPTVKNNIIDITYCDPWSLEAIKQVIQTGHADTIKEALQILEERSRWSKLDSQLTKLLEIAESIRASANLAATGATVNAMVGIMK